MGSGFTALAFLAIRSHLSEAGEQRWSVLALPFIVMSITLFAVLPGMEFAALAAAETGADAKAVQTALFPWFVPILLTSGVSFVLGVLGFARGIADSHVLSPRLTRLTVIALTVMAASRFVPSARFSPTCRARPASWHCGRCHTRCGSIRRRGPRCGRDRSRRPDGTLPPRRRAAFPTATTPATLASCPIPRLSIRCRVYREALLALC